jgi:hypothetical protein
VQVVHYPLFHRVGEGGFAAYEQAHTRRTTFVVAPLMLVESVSGVALPFLCVPPLPALAVGVSLGLVALLWIVTFAVQVPLHRKLERGYERPSVDRLVASNWVRVMLWSARSAVMIWLWLRWSS